MVVVVAYDVGHNYCWVVRTKASSGRRLWVVAIIWKSVLRLLGGGVEFIEIRSDCRSSHMLLLALLICGLRNERANERANSLPLLACVCVHLMCSLAAAAEGGHSGGGPAAAAVRAAVRAAVSACSERILRCHEFGPLSLCAASNLAQTSRSATKTPATASLERAQKPSRGGPGAVLVWRGRNGGGGATERRTGPRQRPQPAVRAASERQGNGG